MAERTASSSLPLPPMQYANLYSDENILRGLAPLPPKPMSDAYRMFGAPFHPDDSIIRPLESQGIRRLHPQSYDPKRELKKLNISILVNFLDMLDILVKCPDTPRREEKKEDLSLLFVHMHHLINEFRPHQARETLRVMLEVQKKQRLETADRFEKQLERVAGMLRASSDQLSWSADSGQHDIMLRLLDSASQMVWASRGGSSNSLEAGQSPEASLGNDSKDHIMCQLTKTRNSLM